MFSFFPTWNPGKSRSTRNAVTPLYPASGPGVGEQQEEKPASAALVIQSFRPFSKKSRLILGGVGHGKGVGARTRLRKGVRSQR